MDKPDKHVKVASTVGIYICQTMMRYMRKGWVPYIYTISKTGLSWHITTTVLKESATKNKAYAQSIIMKGQYYKLRKLKI